MRLQKPRSAPKTRYALATATLGTAAAVLSFAIVRHQMPDASARADPNQPAGPTVAADSPETPAPLGEVAGPDVWGGVGEEHPPPPDVTPEPGATPDTTQAWWYVPYVNADRQQPVVTQTLNGITFGPDVQRVDRECVGDLTVVDLEAISSAELAISVGVLGRDYVNEYSFAAQCDGVDWLTELHATLPSSVADDGDGGSVVISRYRGSPQATADIPAYRWRSSTIAGRPAVIADPILPDLGFGQSVAASYSDGVFTVVTGFGLTTNELVAIMEAQSK